MKNDVVFEEPPKEHVTGVSLSSSRDRFWKHFLLRDFHLVCPVEMTARGRGCLELRPSDNPFFQPMSTDFGKTAQEGNVEWKVSGSPPRFSSKKHQVDGNFMFLYTRESDRIGQKVAKPQLKELKMLSKTEFLRQRRERMQAEAGEEEEQDEFPTEAQTTVHKVNAEELLKIYRHEPKQEDPRYITSAVSLLLVYI